MSALCIELIKISSFKSGVSQCSFSCFNCCQESGLPVPLQFIQPLFFKSPSDIECGMCHEHWVTLVTWCVSANRPCYSAYCRNVWHYLFLCVHFACIVFCLLPCPAVSFPWPQTWGDPVWLVKIQDLTDSLTFLPCRAPSVTGVCSLFHCCVLLSLCFLCGDAMFVLRMGYHAQ